jgi:excisionase family DNA binding protein
MGDMNGTYHTLDSLAARLGLPKVFLRDLARRGKIPSLRVGRWQRFDEADVRAALRKLAAEGRQ